MAKVQAIRKQSPAEPDVSDILPDGEGADDDKTLLTVIYGAPGAGKTHACSNLPDGTKWIATDPNLVATLRALGRLPAKKHLYKVSGVLDCKELCYKMLDAIEQKGLKIPAVVLDSMTTLNNWHQADVAKDHGQKYLGQRLGPKQDGAHWQDFNSSMGGLIEALSQLSKKTHVVVICHATEKSDVSKGVWHGLSLTPKVAERMAQTANWVLYATTESRMIGDGEPTEADEFSTVVESGSKNARVKTRITRTLYTQPIGIWTVKCANTSLRAEEPNDVAALLKKEGLL